MYLSGEKSRIRSLEIFRIKTLYLLDKFQFMLYDPVLRERGRKDLFPKPEIEESIRGVEMDFYYTGKKLGSGTQIELHITSIVRDWEETVYIRKSWYSGNKQSWKECIDQHLRNHLKDLSTGQMLILNLMRDFEVREEHFRTWEKYEPVCF